jgi:tubulin--tyrosine ligase-like protein 12
MEPNEHSAALYGIDVMLDSEFKPQILEVNYSPDCTRACNYDPNFYNNCFSVMFLPEGAGPSTTWEAVTKL